jgi:hypothetical protein
MAPGLPQFDAPAYGELCSMTLKRMVIAFAAIVLMSLTAASAKADSVTYTLDNVNFVGGGSATGSFSYNFATNDFTAINIVVAGALNTPTQTFTLGNLVPNDFGNPTGWCASCDPLLGMFDQFTLNDGKDILFLDLLLPTPMSDNNLVDPLVPDPMDLTALESDLYFDCSNDPDNPGCNDFDGVSSGSLIAGVPTSTPEPSTLLLLAIGVAGMLCAYAWRRKLAVPAVAQA